MNAGHIKATGLQRHPKQLMAIYEGIAVTSKGWVGMRGGDEDSGDIHSTVLQLACEKV